MMDSDYVGYDASGGLGSGKGDVKSSNTAVKSTRNSLVRLFFLPLTTFQSMEKRARAAVACPGINSILLCPDECAVPSFFRNVSN